MSMLLQSAWEITLYNSSSFQIKGFLSSENVYNSFKSKNSPYSVSKICKEKIKDM